MTEAPIRPEEDVNEAVRADWEAETFTFERVRTVMKRTYDPQAANEIASRALTTPITARKHLGLLLEDGFVTATSEPGRSATLYRRSAESLVLEQARDILRKLDTEELADRITGLQAEVREYRADIGADSLEDAVLEDVEVDRETFQTWRTTRRRSRRVAHSTPAGPCGGSRRCGTGAGRADRRTR